MPEGKSESWINQNEARGLPKSIEHANTHIITPTVIYKFTYLFIYSLFL
jgi:hypothetical protein